MNKQINLVSELRKPKSRPWTHGSLNKAMCPSHKAYKSNEMIAACWQCQLMIPISVHTPPDGSNHHHDAPCLGLSLGIIILHSLLLEFGFMLFSWDMCIHKEAAVNGLKS